MIMGWARLRLCMTLAGDLGVHCVWGQIGDRFDSSRVASSDRSNLSRRLEPIRGGMVPVRPPRGILL